MPTDPINTLAAKVLTEQGAQSDLPRIAADPGSFLDRFTLDLPDLVLVVIIVACAIVLIRVAMRMRGGTAEWVMPGDPQQAGAGAQAHWLAAQGFAASGRLQEAMHELLLQALTDIRRHGGQRLDASLTSREIMRSARLPGPAQDALGGMITQVEWIYFGLRPATAAGWEACLAGYARLGDALAGQA